MHCSSKRLRLAWRLKKGLTTMWLMSLSVEKTPMVQAPTFPNNLDPMRNKKRVNESKRSSNRRSWRNSSKRKRTSSNEFHYLIFNKLRQCLMQFIMFSLSNRSHICWIIFPISNLMPCYMALNLSRLSFPLNIEKTLSIGLRSGL